MELYELGVAEARSALDRGEIGPVDLTESVFSRIDAVEERVRSYVTLEREHALQRAAAAGKDARSSSGKALLGIPVAVKDNICTRGVRTTCSSAILSNFVPPYESTCTQKLRDAGYILTGKTNLDEFAMGSSTENSSLGRTCNPWDLARVPGGSSGGAAAAVAADECIAAIGSDTGVMPCDNIHKECCVPNTFCQGAYLIKR